MDVLTCDTFPREMKCNQFQQSINEAFYDTLDDDDDIIPPTPQKRMIMMMNHRTKESSLLRNHQKGKSAATTAVCVVTGLDIKRDLKVHVRKGELKTENVYAKAEVCKHGKRQRGPSFKPNCKITSTAMRRKKWCPVANCTAL